MAKKKFDFKSEAPNLPKDPSALRLLEHYIELGQLGELEPAGLPAEPRYLVTYMNSQTGGAIRSATVVSVTNQSRTINRVFRFVLQRVPGQHRTRWGSSIRDSPRLHGRFRFTQSPRRDHRSQRSSQPGARLRRGPGNRELDVAGDRRQRSRDLHAGRQGWRNHGDHGFEVGGVRQTEHR